MQDRAGLGVGMIFSYTALTRGKSTMLFRKTAMSERTLSSGERICHSLTTFTTSFRRAPLWCRTFSRLRMHCLVRQYSVRTPRGMNPLRELLYVSVHDLARSVDWCLTREVQRVT